MNISVGTIRFFILASLLCLGGCVSQSPTISHTHIGHAMTGWMDTPGEKGLFVTAENAAKDALQSAESASNRSNDLTSLKINVANAIKNTKSSGSDSSDIHYTVHYALTGAMDHISFAENSPDASENVKNSTKSFTGNAKFILDRCDLVLALGEEILTSTSLDEAKLLASELYKLANANVNGEDIDGDGVTGTIPAEYGLKQLRTQLQAMIDREMPPYRTVDTWYLFNLVRLPNGDWFFRSSPGGGGYSNY